VRSARDFGLVCDGLVDDTAALQSALNSLASYQALQLPAGTCKTSKYVSLYGKTNVIVFGAGKDATILAAQTPTSSAFVVEQSNGVTLQDFQVYSPNATTRINDGGGRAFSVNNSTNVTLQRIKGRKTNNAVAFFNVTNSKILNSEALDTFADSFHITGKTSGIVVQFNKATNSGDDSFSSIGYAGTPLSDVQFLDNESYDAKWASCYSFEGTTSGKALRNKCYRSGAAGIRIQSWNTYPTNAQDNIEIADNYIEGAVTRPEMIDAHAPITIVTNYNYLHGITVARNTIKDPKAHNGILASGLNATVNVTATATNNIMLNTTGALKTPFAVGAYTAVTKSGNTLNGASI